MTPIEMKTALVIIVVVFASFKLLRFWEWRREMEEKKLQIVRNYLSRIL